jgi:hypothetical protein
VEILATKIRDLGRIRIVNNWGMSSIFRELVLNGTMLEYVSYNIKIYLDIPPVTSTIYIIPHWNLFAIFNQELTNRVPFKYPAETRVAYKFQNPIHNGAYMDDKFFCYIFACGASVTTMKCALLELSRN